MRPGELVSDGRFLSRRTDILPWAGWARRLLRNDSSVQVTGITLGRGEGTRCSSPVLPSPTQFVGEGPGMGGGLLPARAIHGAPACRSRRYSAAIGSAATTGSAGTGAGAS